MSLSEAKNAIASSLDKTNTVTVSYSGTARGEASPTGAPSSGIYIYRDGNVKSGNINGDFSIVIEGGNSSWVGALSDSVSPAITAAQHTMLYKLTEYIQRTNPNIDLDIQI